MLPAPATGTGGREGGDDGLMDCLIIPSSHPPIIPFTPPELPSDSSLAINSRGRRAPRRSIVAPHEGEAPGREYGVTRAVRRAPAVTFRTPTVAASQG
jgi:hypothetical protein